MWNKIVDDKTLINLLEEVEFFHDACLTELRYISGAYVDEDLAMYPINDKRKVMFLFSVRKRGKIQLSWNSRALSI